VNDELVLWRQLFSQGQESFHDVANELLGEPLETIELRSLSLLFSHSELGPLVIKMLSQIEQIKINHPQRQLDGHVPLYEGDLS
jgi:hypothetical protein